jgi:hypothetical protein
MDEYEAPQLEEYTTETLTKERCEVCDKVYKSNEINDGVCDKCIVSFSFGV